MGRRQFSLVGPVVDHRSSSHPARCRDPAAGERLIDATHKKNYLTLSTGRVQDTSNLPLREKKESSG